MNILVNLPPGFFVHPGLEPLWARLAARGTVRQTSHNTGSEIVDDLAWAEAVLMWSWPAWTDTLLDAAPNLRYAGHLDITQRGAKAILPRGLPVSVSRHGFSPAVAEFALALILNTLRKVSDFQAQMRTGTEPWVVKFPTEIDPQERELTGRSVGIVGFGRVGRRLGELLAPFHPQLYVADPFASEDSLNALGARRVLLPELVAECEIIVLCAASNDGTRHLFGPAEFAAMRPDAVFVNVARAALVDTDALIARLREGNLFAALDVFDTEPLPSDSPLRDLPNAFLTPHRAGGTLASVNRIVSYLIDDLEAVINEEPRHHALTEAMIPSLDA